VIGGILEQLRTRRLKGSLLPAGREAEAAHRFHSLQRMRLGLERMGSQILTGGRGVQVASTACWEFPVYSQTFVYQELTELARHGFDLRFLYSKLNARSHLPRQFSAVWRAKRKLVLHQAVCERDYAYYCGRMPEKVATLSAMVSAASGMPLEALQNHHHFKQAFAFTRTVEASRPDYLHSYFFYEGTLFTLFASYLLDIPRGVSCYADHMLDDYALKLVPLHLQQCELVIATSARIKRELTGIAPQTDPDRILVKPNAIDAGRFPVMARREPARGEPFRLSCVSRIEPKKGLLYLADALRQLLSRGFNVSAHILGGVDENEAGRSYAQALEARIRELEIGHAFHLEGRRSGPEVRRFLNDSHLFVAPFVETDSGDKDGIPTALLEAMATGLPAVATDAGSITEVIGNGRDGLIAPQRDGAALGEAIGALLADPERRRRMGLNAADTIRRSFDVGVCEHLFHQRIRALTAGRRKESRGRRRDARA